MKVRQAGKGKVPRQIYMGKGRGGRIGAGLDGQGFEPVTKLGNGLLAGFGTVGPFGGLRVLKDWNEAGIGIKAQA